MNERVRERERERERNECEGEGSQLVGKLLSSSIDKYVRSVCDLFEFKKLKNVFSLKIIKFKCILFLRYK